MYRADKVFEMLDTVCECISALKQHGGSIIEEVTGPLSTVVTTISNDFYLDVTKESQDVLRKLERVGKDDKDIKKMCRGLSEWAANVRADIEKVCSCTIALDGYFERLMLRLERCGKENLCAHVLNIVKTIEQKDPENYERMKDFYHYSRHLWGEFDPDNGIYDHFLEPITEMCKNTEAIRRFYDSLADYRSKMICFRLLAFWLDRDFKLLDGIREENFDEYFDLDVFGNTMTKDEVFVDCGAYDGDTIDLFLKNINGYKRLYLYDMVPINLKIAQKHLEAYADIEYRNVGVGSKEQTEIVVKVRDVHETEFSLLVSDGEISDEKDVSYKEVGIVTLDEDISERITFLKMDIEGAEPDALKGAERHIREEKPKLAICLYHKYAHLWEIPGMISRMRHDYKFYLRYNGLKGGLMSTEYVLLAV